MIKSIKLQNFLSFGENSKVVKLNPLNIIIGANGSGKSNFLEAFDLLRSTPSDITKPIREGGGIKDWLYKGSRDSKNAVMDFVIVNKLKDAKADIRYNLSFGAVGNVTQQFELFDEMIQSENPTSQYSTEPYLFYGFYNGKPMINIKGVDEERKLEREDIDMSQSILSQRRDSALYPEITFLSNEFSKIRLYRDWSFGRYTPARLPQKGDLKNDFLDADCSNLCLVLNQMELYPDNTKKILSELSDFYADVEGFKVIISSGLAQLFFHERRLRTAVPATRLSDGSLRYLCLLSILCHPFPPPLVCIEEPELGMHPDIISKIAELLKDASKRCQLVVTTHSKELVDCFSETPEDIMVAEKSDDGTQIERLDKEQLKPWLEKYRLGELWSRGDIGGTRW